MCVCVVTMVTADEPEEAESDDEDEDEDEVCFQMLMNHILFYGLFACLSTLSTW